MSMYCLTVNMSTVCTPQAFLPIKKWEAAWLGWLSAVLVPKATFLEALYDTWGFSSVIQPKITGKKNSQVTSFLGLEPCWGNPSTARSDADKMKGLRYWDALQFLNRAAGTVVGFVYSVNDWHWLQCQAVWAPSACLPGYQHTAATCWHVCQAKSICVLYLCQLALTVH